MPSQFNKSAVALLFISALAVILSGCSHDDSSPANLAQQKAQVTGTPAPAGALQQYYALHPSANPTSASAPQFQPPPSSQPKQ